MTPPPEFDRFAVITIQGGGIYGLNLLGQLSYLIKELQVVPVAVAGNSAGSIVAALYWAGYKPWEIRDIFAQMAAEGRLARLVGPFVPPSRPFTLWKFRKLVQDCDRFVRRHLIRPNSAHPGGLIGRVIGKIVRGFPALCAALSLGGRIAPHFANRGSFTGEEFEREIDALIRRAPAFLGRGDLPQGRLLTFGDVRDLTRRDPAFSPPALFITATNVTKRTLQVFDSIDPRHDAVPIAKAVRASAGFPGFFRPVEFRDADPADAHSSGESFSGWYADGGVVSNYPAWVFAPVFRLRLLDSPNYRVVAARPWAHFGLRLDRAPVGGDPLTSSPQVYFSSLARLLVGEARSELDDRLAALVTRSFEVRQPDHDTGVPPDIDLLDVDRVTRTIVEDMYDKGSAEAARILRSIGYAMPDRPAVEKQLMRLVDKALLILNQIDQAGRPDNSKVCLRCNVYIPNDRALIPRYAVHMAGHSDEHLELPSDTGLTGFCFFLRRPLICNLEQIGSSARTAAPGEGNLFGMTPAQHALVRSDRTWLASVPIFDPLASYPSDLSAAPLPHRAIAVHTLSGQIDGAMLGVLNLDASLPYTALGINPDPAQHWTDPRIEGMVHLMMLAATEVGQLLSSRFARPTSEGPRQ